MEDAIRSKVARLHAYRKRSSNSCLQITATLSPTALEIHNDSHLHSHHKAMEGSTSREVRSRRVYGPRGYTDQVVRHTSVFT